MRSEVFVAVILKMVIWITLPCGLLSGYERFGGNSLFYLQHMEAEICYKIFVTTYKIRKTTNVKPALLL
jgi:hypothetical protein